MTLPEESKEHLSSSGKCSKSHQSAWEESMHCQKKNSRCQMSDSWSEIQLPFVYISPLPALEGSPGLCPGTHCTGVLTTAMPWRWILKCDSRTLLLLWAGSIPFENSCYFFNSREVWIRKRLKQTSICVWTAGFTSGCALMDMYTHIPAVFSLYCFLSKFLSHCSKYCYFSYFSRVWSPPAAGSELLVLMWMSWGVQRVVRYWLVPSQILTITFPSRPCLPEHVGNICGFREFLLEMQKEISFPNLMKKRWSDIRPDSRCRSWGWKKGEMARTPVSKKWPRVDGRATNPGTL